MTNNKKLSLLALILLVASCSSNFSKKSDSANSSNKNKEVVNQKTKEVTKAEVAKEEHVVFFDTNESKLTQEAINVLDQNVLPLIKASKASKITIEGYCDERGAIAYNKKLGKKRASAVKAYLVKNGVKSSLVKVKSYGKSNPVDGGHNEEAWKKNRRAVSIIIKK